MERAPGAWRDVKQGSDRQHVAKVSSWLAVWGFRIHGTTTRCDDFGWEDGWEASVLRLDEGAEAGAGPDVQEAKRGGDSAQRSRNSMRERGGDVMCLLGRSASWWAMQ